MYPHVNHILRSPILEVQLRYTNFDALIMLTEAYDILAFEKSSSGCAAWNFFNA